MAIDPVCGMEVEKTKAAATVECNGATYYFCSSACHKAFRANPRQYSGADCADAPPRTEGGVRFAG